MLFFFFPRRKHKKVLTGVKEMEDSGVGCGAGCGGKPVLYILHFSELFIFSNNIYSPLPFNRSYLRVVGLQILMFFFILLV